MVMPNLPKEMIEDILSRLPVKSLLKFRCVCKSWNSLIISNCFINMHLNRTTTDPNNQNNQSLFMLSDDHIYSLKLSKPRESDVVVPKELEFSSVEYTPDKLKVMGSCNGLVLVSGGVKTLFLVNPSTRESKKLPDFPFPVQTHPEIIRYSALYGFGYDYSHNDYKVLMIDGFRRHPPLYGSKVAVYTLRSNDWKVIGTSPYKHRSGKPSGALLNGAIHWVDRRCSDGSWVIASFDLSSERFMDVPPPSTIDDIYMYMLGVVGGCLCMMWVFEGSYHDVWVMREYGVRESWTKFRIADPRSAVEFLCFLRNWIVLWEEEWGRQKLVLYDSEKETYVDVVVDGLDDIDAFQAVAYVESLVSPNLGGAVAGPHLAPGW